MSNFFGGTHRRPTWRKAGTHEGFRQSESNHTTSDGSTAITDGSGYPRSGGCVSARSRSIADTVKSYRVTLDRSGRWHIAFAVIPDPIPGPGDHSVAGVDRGVAVSAALSSGELLHAPGLRAGETKRLRRLQQRLARAQRGSARRANQAGHRESARPRDRSPP